MYLSKGFTSLTNVIFLTNSHTSAARLITTFLILLFFLFPDDKRGKGKKNKHLELVKFSIGGVEGVNLPTAI